MDTLEFLRTILPADCVTFAVVFNGKFLVHKGFQSLSEMASYIQQEDAKGATTVYHACAGYIQPAYTVFDKNRGKEVKAYRKEGNWKYAQSFWIDIDCGEDKHNKGEGYLTQRDAAVALITWCKKRGMPVPMIVKSGNGLHAYWLLTEPVTPDKWIPLAEDLKATMAEDGLLADPTRTADFASILRPVGSTHKKDPNNPRPVELIGKVPERVSYEFIRGLDLVQAHKEAPFDLQAPSWLKDEEAEQIQTAEYPSYPVSVDKIADSCHQVGMMRDTKGDVGYEHWRGVIGLIKTAGADIDVAYDWSSLRAETGHAQTDVSTKYNTWSSPPTTCEHFLKCNPSGCDGCPHKGKIKTPLVLGREEPKTEVETVSDVVLEEDGRAQKISIEVPEMPAGYDWVGETMVRYVKDKDGVLQAHPFCRTRFYLAERIRNAEGRYEYLMRVHLPKGVIRSFPISGGLIGAGGSKLFEMLGSYELMPINTKDSNAHMQAYLRDSVHKMTVDRDVAQTYTHFGWQDDGSFLVGSRLYKRDGKITEALLSGNALDQKGVFPTPRGTMESYAAKINWVYNRQGMEPLQYLICSLWAAPLVEFCEPTYNGIPCAVTGADSGKGKSTAATAALYAFGNAYPGLVFAGKEGATAKAQSTFLGTLRNLPVLFDEVTNKDSRALSDLCYSLSNGVESMRLRSSGGQVTFGNRESWRTQVAMTANSHIGARLAESGNSEAEAMRVFEIRIDHYKIPKLDPLAVSAALADMERNTGAAGEVLITWLVTNHDEAVQILTDTYGDFVDDPVLMTEPRYRFYRNHMACTIATAKIAKKLGIMDFDIERLTKFAQRAVADLLNAVNGTNILSQSDVFSSMMAELSPRIITTETLTVDSNRQPYEVRQPREGIVGRAIRGSAGLHDEYDGQLFLSAKAVSEWCSANRGDVAALSEHLVDEGILISRNKRATLTKGTNAVSAQQRCWILDLNKMEVEDDPSQVA